MREDDGKHGRGGHAHAGLLLRQDGIFIAFPFTLQCLPIYTISSDLTNTEAVLSGLTLCDYVCMRSRVEWVTHWSGPLSLARREGPALRACV